MASVIFSLLMLGMVSVFISSGKHITHSRERISSIEVGKLFLDPLQVHVRQDTWNSNALNISSTPVSFGTQTINNRPFSATYTVADGSTAPIDPALTGTGLRRVIATITWDEHS